MDGPGPWGPYWQRLSNTGDRHLYSHLHVGMMLKHFKSGRCGIVLGWGDHNGDPYVHLYFADREPAEKNESRSKCYEWRRLSAFVPMSEPLVKEKVFKPHDPEGDEHDAKKMAEGVTPPGKQGAAVAASSTNVAMQHEPAPEPAKSEISVEVDMAKADKISFADADFIMVDETPKEEMKNELLNEVQMRRKE